MIPADLTEEQTLTYRQAVRAWVTSFAPIPEKELSHHSSLLHFHRVKRGEFLVKEGQQVTDVKFVLTGLFKMFSTNSDGKLFVQKFCAEGEIVSPYISLVLRENSKQGIVALEDSIIAGMKFVDLLQLYDRHPIWERVGRLAAEKLLLENECRIHSLSLLDAKERYLDFVKRHKRILHRLSQYEIAHYLSITPVSLSRIKKNLEVKIQE